MHEPLTTPVVLIIFNRPDLARRVLAEIRRARPERLIVLADGPRVDHHADAERCAQARAVIDEVDWPCEITREFSDVNLGCGTRIGGGLTHVFEQVEEAIILEDDCIPAPSFFRFCQMMLDRYRDDTRVMHVGANNFQRGRKFTPHSYHFSRYPHISGWATWRRAWAKFDRDLTEWPRLRNEGWLREILDDELAVQHWTRKFDHVHRDKPNLWGCSWTCACMLNGLSIYPTVSLVSHIGVGGDATNHREAAAIDYLPTGDIWDIDHPPCVLPCREADQYEFNHLFGGNDLRRGGPPPVPLRTRLWRVKQRVRSWARPRQATRRPAAPHCRDLPDGIERVYFRHVPRAAGTSVSELFLMLAGESETVARDAWRNAGSRFRLGNKTYVRDDRAAIEVGDYFYATSSHGVDDLQLPGGTFMVTCLRDPVERVLSLYRAMLSRQNTTSTPAWLRDARKSLNGGGFSEFLTRVRSEHLYAQLLMFSPSMSPAEACENVLKCGHVLLTDHFEHGVRMLARRLNLPLCPVHANAAPLTCNVRDEDVDRLRELLAPEYAFVDMVRSQLGLPELAAEPAIEDAPVSPAATTPRAASTLFLQHTPAGLSDIN